MRPSAVLITSPRDCRDPRALNRLALLAGLALAALTICHPVQAQSSANSRCQDYGSFGVVDAPPPRRGEPIVAQPFQPCADLPGAPQPQILIDAQVNVGGEESGIGGGTGTGNDWRPRPEPPIAQPPIIRPPQKPPVWGGPVQPRPRSGW